MLSHVREMISFWISFKALDNAISQMGASFSEGVSPSSANSLPGNMFVILAYQKKKKEAFKAAYLPDQKTKMGKKHKSM